MRLSSLLYMKKYFLYRCVGGIMKEFTIQFNSVQQVQRFVELATQQPYAISLGNSRHQVNGKSFREKISMKLLPLTLWHSLPREMGKGCWVASSANF